MPKALGVLIILMSLIAAAVAGGFVAPSFSDEGQADVPIGYKPMQIKGDASEPPFGLSMDELVEDFIHIATNPHHSERPSASALIQERVDKWVRHLKEVAERKGQPLPWYYEYGAREMGVPPRGKIMKWRKRVVISLGEPEVPIENEASTASQNLGGELPERFGAADAFGFSPYNVVHDQINALTPALSDLTGLEIQYNPTASVSDSNLHVIVGDDGFLYNGFFEWAFLWRHGDQIFQDMIRGKVDMTPGVATQVSGALILDAEGYIDRSICRIYRYHTADMIKALLTECLVRSMGLPRHSLYIPDAVVSRWNQSFDRWEGQEPPLLDDLIDDQISDDEFFSFYGTLAKRTDFSRLRFALTPYDKHLLKHLYNPAVKVGMGEAELKPVLQHIFTSDK